MSQTARKLEEYFNQVVYQEALVQYQKWKASEAKTESDSQADGSVRSTPEPGSAGGSTGQPSPRLHTDVERKASISLGLSDGDKTIAKRVLKKVKDDPASHWFHAPV